MLAYSYDLPLVKSRQCKFFCERGAAFSQFGPDSFKNYKDLKF